MQKFICTFCGYIYDPETGDPEKGVIPITIFEDLPEDWRCPCCGSEYFDFQEL
ncbi:MAG: rubredoxin [Firmicutes bacterium HGW-Firmicutes-13]|nr:MAG: rubredoxin [Firmicutes bacterium HGW-Firmicutes-13]